MTEKDVVASAIKEVEKEKQEAEISKIKGVVKAYLEKISSKKEKLREVQNELKELEADLNDLKMGRLDKIEERQEKDPDHNKITLIIIKKVEKEFIPYQPWRSPYLIERRYGQSTVDLDMIPCTTTSSLLMNQNSMNTSVRAMRTTGVMFQNFSGGTYDINGQIVSFY